MKLSIELSREDWLEIVRLLKEIDWGIIWSQEERHTAALATQRFATALESACQPEPDE